MNAIVDTSNGEISCCLKFALNAPQIVIAYLQIWQDVYQILNAKCSVKKKMILVELECLQTVP